MVQLILTKFAKVVMGLKLNTHRTNFPVIPCHV